MIKISSFLLISFISLVVFTSQIGMHSEVTPLFAGLGIFSFVLLNIILIIIKQRMIIDIPYISKFIYMLFFGLIFSSIFSYFITGRLKAIIVYGALISLFFTTRIASKYIKNIDHFIINLVFGVCLAGVVIIILSLENKAFTMYRYKGFYTNANSMGMFAAGLIHMTVGVLYSYTNIERKKKLFFYSILSSSILFLLASNARSALISSLLVILLIPLIEFYKSIGILTLKIYINYLKRFFYFLTLIALFFLIIYYSGLLDNTIDKFVIKAKAGDISDGRLQSWIIQIQNWTWFGHENLTNISEKKIIRGHSTWVSHLNYYGFFAVSFFIILIFYMFNWAWGMIRNNNNSNSAKLFFFILIGYFVNASFETSTSSPGLLISIALFGILYKKKVS